MVVVPPLRRRSSPQGLPTWLQPAAAPREDPLQMISTAKQKQHTTPPASRTCEEFRLKAERQIGFETPFKSQYVTLGHSPSLKLNLPH